MKNRIHPTWDEIKNLRNPLTKGEEKLARFLDDALPGEWEIFVQPYLNGNRPDIAVFNPQVGVMIYEVKDWNLNSYNFKDGQLFFSDKKSSYLEEGPIKQVNHYKKKIIELVPRLGEEIDRNKSAFGLVKTGLYLHKASGEDAREFFNNPARPVIFGYDDLYDSNLENILPFFISKEGYMRKEWAEEIRWWLAPPFHNKEQIRPLTLSDQQKETAKPQPGHFRLRGVVGSGKTLILAYRAAKLASQGFKVLVITFNITLLHYIRDMIVRAPFGFDPSNITYNHFHGFCNDVLNELGVPKPYENYLSEVVPRVKYALEMAGERGKNLENLKFDAILIDEGQDYEWEWYDCLCDFLRERDELLLVCDKKQNIYERDLRWIDGGMRNVKFRGPWRELKTVCRIPKKIGAAANRFSSVFGLDQQLEVEEYIQLKLSERPLKSHLVWKNIRTEDWLFHIEEAYEKIKSEKSKYGEGHASDIVILFTSRSLGMDTVEYFEMKGVGVNHVFEDVMESKYHRHKKSFWTGDSRLKMSTVHSFKGWGAAHVILLIPEKWSSQENLNAVVYTAMTRTHENLIVLNCNERYVEFGRSLSSEWGVQ